MKIGATSDLHGNLPDIEPCDILFICGDIIPLHYQTNMISSLAWFQTKFLPWCRDNAAKNVVFIAGNHDFALERSLDLKAAIKEWQKYNIYYVENSLIQIEGLKIFGTPYCQIFGPFAFMYTDEQLQQFFYEIPEGVDVLISHDAPNLCKLGTIQEGRNAGVEAGSGPLAVAIIEKKPKIVFCGHIHSGDHQLTALNPHTIGANVSLVNEAYKPVNNVLYYEIQSEN